jgi:ABC-type nitrate/sulfonate/bicarbonate transport system substrate-binding protein
MNRKRSITLSCAIAALAVAGCSSASSSSTSSSSQQETANISIVGTAVCNPPSIFNLDNYDAKSGCAPAKPFAANHLNVNFQTVSGSPVAVAAVVSGKSAFASISPSTFFAAIAQGEKLQIVVSNYMSFPWETIALPSVKTVKDLTSGPVAASSIGASNYTQLVTYLQNTGNKSIADKINWVSAGGLSAELQYLTSHRAIAVTATLADSVQIMAKDPTLHVLISADQYKQVYPQLGTIIVATDSYVKANPQIVQNVQKAYIQSNRQLNSSLSYATKLTDTILPGLFTPVQEKQLLQTYDAALGVNGGLDLATWQQQVKSYETVAAPKSSDSLSDVQGLIDTTDLKVVLDAIGKVESSEDPGTF